MHGPRARGGIAAAVGHVVILRAGFGHDLDARANAVAIALRALQLELDPVILAGTLVHPDFRRSTERAHDYVEASVAVQVAERRPAMPRRRARLKASLAGESPKLHSAEIAEDRVGLLDLQIGRGQRLDVPAGHEDVFPPIIVEVGD